MYVMHVITFSRLGINRNYYGCCNPARGQLSKENNFPLSPLAPVNLVSRGGFGRPVPSMPAHSPYSGSSWCLLTDSSTFCRFPHRYPFIIPSTAIGSLPSLSGHATEYLWHLPPRVRRHLAGSPQGSSSNGCCLFRKPDGQFSVCHSIFTQTIILVYCTGSNIQPSID